LSSIHEGKVFASLKKGGREREGVRDREKEDEILSPRPRERKSMRK
jgi:hypothetical protein